MAEKWKLEGTYMEACTCDVACPCVFLSDPTEGDCKGYIAWHIDKGAHGDTKLDNLNVALALHSPGNMGEGNFKVALYLDERASDQQKEALTQIFGGQAGGHPANLAELIGEVLGVQDAPIDFTTNGKQTSIKVGNVGEAVINAVEGPSGDTATVSNHLLAVAPGFTATIAKSEKNTFSDQGLSWEVSDKNGMVSPFAYEGP